MNKRGEASDWTYMMIFLFLLALFFGSITLGTKVFFGKGYDFRDVEAQILFLEVRDCFMENNFSEAGFDVFKACGFNENLKTNHMVYISGPGFDKPLVIGVGDFTEQCDFNKDLSKKNRNLPRCVKKKIVKNGEEFNFIVGSNQNSRSVIG